MHYNLLRYEEDKE